LEYWSPSITAVSDPMTLPHMARMYAVLTSV
jgi:hypothetical protein